MNVDEAVELAGEHARRWGLSWEDVAVSHVGRERSCWRLFVTTHFLLELETGAGPASVCVDVATRAVVQFVFKPTPGSGQHMLPLWAAFPGYSSVTIGWRMGTGEAYRHAWHAWYGALDNAEQARYRDRFPPPDDEANCWEGFYEW
ncbi:MAG: hypothetical protein AB7N76_12645 [Planctomycetota bacterium]